MKRLVVSGFGCPPESWTSYLGEGTEVISFYDYISATNSSDISKWSRYVSDELEKRKPTSVVCHDYGGIVLLMALSIRAEKGLFVPTHLTILNTAFKDFDVFKNPHPLTLQLMTWSFLSKAVEKAKGHIDPRLEPYFPLIKATYRKVILASALRKIVRLVKKKSDDPKPLVPHVQLLASPNDPFIALQTMKDIAKDFQSDRFLEIPYGHFPYIAKTKDKVREAIFEFERK